MYYVYGHVQVFKQTSYVYLHVGTCVYCMQSFCRTSCSDFSLLSLTPQVLEAEDIASLVVCALSAHPRVDVSIRSPSVQFPCKAVCFLSLSLTLETWKYSTPINYSHSGQEEAIQK